MLIKLSEINHTGISRNGEIPRDQFSRLNKRYQFEILKVQSRLKLIENEQVTIEVDYQVKVQTHCDSCLENATIDLDENFSLDLITQGHDQKAESDHHELTMEMIDTDFFDGHQILLETYIEDQLLLDIPLKVLCNEACQGLCAHCGAAKSLKECDCESKNNNSPFAVLKDMLGKQ